MPFGNGATLSFGVKPLTGGAQGLTATVNGLTVQASITVDPAVRRGTCTFPANTLTTTCSISPAQHDLAHTLLVFQAVSPGTTAPVEAEVRCRLSGVTQITCARNAVSSSPANAAIWWQTLELPSGLAVTRGFDNAGCPASSVTLPSPVDVTTSFNLSSVSAIGANYDADDMTSTRLSSDGLQLIYEPVVPGNNCVGHEYQVATMSGVSVVRGVSAGFSSIGPSTRVQTVGGLAAASSSSVLLTQSNLLGASPPASASMCHFFARGELDSATTLKFSRGSTLLTGCDSYATGNLTWQRLDFGSRASVQPFTVTLTSTTATQTITAVDPTRALVFSGGMMTSGLATGESANTNSGTDQIGDALASFELAASQVTVRRAGATAAATFTFYVVQLQP